MSDLGLFEWVLFLFVVVFFIGSLLLARQWKALSQQKQRHLRAIHNAQFGLWQWLIGPDRFELSLDFIEGFDEHHIEVSNQEDWLAHLNDHDKGAFIEWLTGLKEGNIEPGLRLSLTSAEGIAHWIEMRGSVVDRDKHGNALCIAGTVHCVYHLIEVQASLLKEQSDATENISMQEALQRLGEEQDDEVEGLDRALQKEAQQQQSQSHFLANMSHEIRTPLNAIIGYAQLLSEDTQFEGIAQTRFQAIIDAGERLLNMLNDIIDIARIEAGRLDLQGHKTKLRHEINHCVDLIRPLASNKGLALEFDDELSDSLCVWSDSVKLQRIISNILSNAVHFTDKGHVAIKASYEHDLLTLIIEDTGKGMEDKQIEHLFTPFIQERNSCPKDGTGLGLALTNTLVKLMEGELIVDSMLGQGTKVTIRLPLKQDTDDIMPILSAENASHVRLTRPIEVLVADDDDWSRDILLSLLEKAGCKTLEATNGEEALHLFEHHHPELVLTDIRMPKMDGHELLEEIRQRNHRVPVIAVTASSLVQEHQALLDYGFWEVISKPYKVEVLYQGLVNHLDSVTFERNASPDNLAVKNLIAQEQNTQNQEITQPIEEMGATEAQWLPLLRAAQEGDMGQVERSFRELRELLSHQQCLSLKMAIDAFDLGQVERLIKEYCPELV